MSGDDTRRPRRLGAWAAGGLCAVALAVGLPASGALAGGGSEATGGSGSAPSTAPAVQSQDGGGQRDGDCPEKDGGGSEGSSTEPSSEV
jgi:hypothetical protein